MSDTVTAVTVAGSLLLVNLRLTTRKHLKTAWD